MIFFRVREKTHRKSRTKVIFNQRWSVCLNRHAPADRTLAHACTLARSLRHASNLSKRQRSCTIARAHALSIACVSEAPSVFDRSWISAVFVQRDPAPAHQLCSVLRVEEASFNKHRHYLALARNGVVFCRH